MSPVRNLLADLVARRLWPVALALVVALVAVPVLLGKKAEEVSTHPGTKTDTADSRPLVSVASDAPTGGRTPIGRNPFVQKDVAPAAPESSIPSSGGSTGGASPSGGGAIGGGLDIPGGLDDIDVIPVGGGADPAPAEPKEDRRESYRVDLRFGTDGELTTRRDVPRLSPLPSSEDPFFVFLGVLADGKTALFLVSSDADATGDGKCRPNPSSCERIEMRAGDTEFFDVAQPDGKIKQYQLDVLDVSRQRSASAAVASAARSRIDTGGRKALRNAVATKQVDVSDIAYAPELGLLVPTSQTGSHFGGFRTDLRFGPPGDLVKRYNIARLTPLPSVDSPSLLFMGVIGEDNEAFFLNPSEAATSGDAECDPSPEDCSRVRLGAGENALFDVPTLDGRTTEYELAIDAITPVEADSAAEADALRDRESPAGRIILRRLLTEVGGLVADVNYSSDRGKLYRVETPGS